MTHQSSSRIFAALFVLSGALAGCGTDLHEMAKKAGKELGVKIEVVAPKDDYCQLSQFEKLIEEYGSLKPAKKDDFRAKLQQYPVIRLFSTEIVQTVEGSMTLLRLWKYVDGGYRGEVFKTIENTLKRSGQNPRTLIAKSVAEGITVATQRTKYIDVIRHDFYTRDDAVYESINSVNDPRFIELRSNPEVFWQNDVPVDPIECGQLADLDDLMKQLNTENLK